MVASGRTTDIKFNANQKNENLTVQLVLGKAALSRAIESSKQNHVAPRTIGKTVPPITNRFNKGALLQTVATAVGPRIAAPMHQTHMHLNPPSSTPSSVESVACNGQVSPTELLRRLKRVLIDREHTEINPGMHSSEFAQYDCFMDASTDSVISTNSAFSGHSYTSRTSAVLAL